jgi:hypothetical protein
VAALTPRDVDFYVPGPPHGPAQALPRAGHEEGAREEPAWASWLASPEYQSLERDLELEQNLKELRSNWRRSPSARSLLTVFGGRDLALAGYFHGQDLQQADWAVYGRANWMGKLAASALRHPAWWASRSRA